MLIVKILGTHVRIKDFKIKKNLKKNNKEYMGIKKKRKDMAPVLKKMSFD